MIPDWEVDGVFLADMLKVRHPDLFTQLHSILTSHGVEVRLLTNVKDIWARDYCPRQIGPDEFLQFRYEPDYLKDHPELRTGREVGDLFHELGECRHSDINLDGGNVVASRSKVVVTDKIYRENPSWDRSKLRDELRRVLKVEEVIVIPKEPYDPIGHADAMVRFINDDTVLVNDYAEVDPAFGTRLVNVLCRHGLAIELLTYFHEQRTTDGIPSAFGCYTNFLRTEKVVIVPAYAAEHDQKALDRLKDLMPDVPVVPLDCTNLAREGGVLNCISASFRRSSSPELPRPTSVRAL
jgi:agmatine deiminase